MWQQLNDASTLDQIKSNSFFRPQVIYKHSTRCSLSSMVKSRLLRHSLPQDIDFYELDLIAFRALSQQIADDFKVWHESPQVIVVVNGEAIFDESHMAIRYDELLEQAYAIKPAQAIT